MEPNWLEALLGGNVYRITLEPLSPASLLLSLVPLYFLRRRGKRAGYLLFFYLCSLYVWAVLAFTIVDFPLTSVEIGIMRERGWSRSINLVPTPFTGDFAYWSSMVYGNFLLGIPFGLGLPFVVALSTHRRTILAGLGFATGIEVVQVLLGLVLYQAPYRVFDIDDIWLVFGGTLAGYAGLWVVARVYRFIGWKGGARLPVWDHFHGVLLRVGAGRASPVVPAERKEDSTGEGEGPSEPHGGWDTTEGAETRKQ